MSPDLEAEMEQRIRAGVSARDAAEALLAAGAVASRKQPLRTLEKWSSRGWWEYGVSLDLGWFTDAHPRGSNLDVHGQRSASPTPHGEAPRAMWLAFEDLRPSGDPRA